MPQIIARISTLARPQTELGRKPRRWIWRTKKPESRLLLTADRRKGSARKKDVIVVIDTNDSENKFFLDYLPYLLWAWEVEKTMPTVLL